MKLALLALLSAGLSGCAGCQETYYELDPNQISIYGDVLVTEGTAMVEGVSGGRDNAADWGETPTGPCRGLVNRDPSHALLLDSEAESMTVAVFSEGHTTLIINGPRGRLCYAREPGSDPAITGRRWPAGTYFVYVGSAIQPQRLVHNYGYPYILRVDAHFADGVEASPQ